MNLWQAGSHQLDGYRTIVANGLRAANDICFIEEIEREQT
jgi:hypothetical protein